MSAARIDWETAEHLAALDAAPYIPELHADDCDDNTCVRCGVLTPSNLHSVDPIEVTS
ncbi:hypothetical protein [Streptomyces sp. W4I9-2]|uniref:hypothetical protein n=1 Tax=Streptomyces sp. W4I9-2 TaxID=3042297 RepID=UPI00277F981C|nr:hypothetical protein [Streptomyces sp. W4I9-2]MDQ0694298.1 hypothetical protein [Streptomyces sp. W4I9-2]